MNKKQTIKKVNFGQFEVRASEKQVVFQTQNKNWTTAYGCGTPPYGTVVMMIEQDHIDALHTLTLALYNQTLFFSDPNATLITEFFDSIKRFSDRLELEEGNQDEILEEEKIMENLKQEEE